MTRHWLFWLGVLAAGAATAAAGFEYPSAAAVARADDLKGRVVETRDGEELGRVHDFAVDLANGRIVYVVVSVGSFLIDDSLIAVAPDALRESADADGRLVLETDAASLRAARRFADGDWPRRADVVAQSRSAESEPAGASGDETVSATPSRGMATISDGNKTATLSAGERSIRFVEPPAAPSQPDATASAKGGTAATAPSTRFGRLDSNGDGNLDRAEIAHEMRRGDRFADIDIDASGNIDEGEFDAFIEGRNGGER
ncbi:MAG: PRC-barrel domain-containing protein [Pseudomonadales bacterium]